MSRKSAVVWSGTEWSDTGSSRRCAPATTPGEWQVTVLCEEACPPTTGWGCRPTSASWDPKELALAGNDYAGRRPGRPAGRLSARQTIDRAARTVTTSRGDVLALRRAGDGHRFVPVRAAGPRPRPRPGASSTAPSTTSTASEPAAEAAGPGATASSSAVACSGSRPPTRSSLMGMTPHVVEFAPRLMPLQVDEGGGALLAAAGHRPRPAPCTPACRHRRRSPRDRDGICGRTVRRVR